MEVTKRTYIGTKTIKAVPCNLGDFIAIVKRNPYENSNDVHSDAEEGYMVEYEDGYKSWSPKDVFDKAYRIADTFKDRMIIEINDLSNKIDSLTEFIHRSNFQSIIKSDIESELLKSQLRVMLEYQNILKHRLRIIE